MSALAASIRNWARIKPDDVALALLDGEGEIADWMSREALETAARRVTALAGRAGWIGRPILLPAEPTAAFVAALTGLIEAGAIPTPVPASSRPLGLARLARIVADAGIEHALLTGPASSALRTGFPHLRWWRGDEGGDKGRDEAELPQVDDETPALLQYTSGSTGAPKGIVLTHRNLAANLDMLKAGLGAGPESRILTWLPLHHDMGLVGQLLLALHCGAPLFLMSPLAFIRSPQTWLRAIARHGATISGGPNFAYDVCVKRELPELGPCALKNWKVAFCGAEKVRPATLRAFAERLAPHGFDPRALLPCYGLAEASVYASGGPPGAGLRCAAAASASAPVASCGRAAGRVAIVDPHTGQRLADGGEGEIWIAGPHVAAGYLGPDEDNVFGNRLSGDEDHYLRTGDCGLLRDGELFVTGRLKSLILHRGETIHPEEVESVIVESDPRFQAGAVLAIDIGEEERVVAICEIARGCAPEALAEMVKGARLAVADAFGFRLHAVVPVAPRHLPRTTSGKIRREAARALYQAAALTPLAPPPLPATADA